MVHRKGRRHESRRPLLIRPKRCFEVVLPNLSDPASHGNTGWCSINHGRKLRANVPEARKSRAAAAIVAAAPLHDPENGATQDQCAIAFAARCLRRASKAITPVARPHRT